MWINRFSPKSKFVRYKGGKTVSLQKKFQWKYSLLVTGMVGFAVVVSIVPVFYFFNQNYSIFYELAYRHSPDLLSHLEREKAWLNFFLFGVSIFSIIFCWVFGMKLTARMIGPVLVLQNHIKALTKGDWSINELKVRDNDEFRELISSYNYLYHCLRQVTQEDLVKLEALIIDKNNRNAVRIWQDLIHEKSDQLGIKPSDHASSPEPLHDSRHAS